MQQQVKQECGLSVHQQSERTHNRQTTRIACVFSLPDVVKADWSGAQQGVEVIRQGTHQGLPYQERQYYITSWSHSAEVLQTRIRAHWGIENPLHWVKDVVLGEDQSSIATKPAAALMAVIRNLVITVFRRAGHHSITAAIDRFGNDLNQLLPMLDFHSR